MLKNKKVGQIIIFTVFITVICMQMFWCFIFGIYVDLQNAGNVEELQNIENRKMASKPNFSIYTYSDYFSDYEKYFNDNYPFRSKLISINSKMDYYLFHKSPNKDVILGEDGWLFYTPTLEDYEKSNLYTEEELEAILADVLASKQYFEDRGIEFIIFIAPNKNTIYGEYMPGGIDIADGLSRTEQAVKYIQENSDVRILYPKEEMIKAKIEYPEIHMFFKLDTHWNYMGGYWGAKAILEEFGKEVPSLESLSWEEINEPLYRWNGYDLSNMLGLTDELNQDINYKLKGYSENEVTYEKELSLDQDAFWGSTRTYSNAEDTRKLYFARDSFGEGMVPYLAAAFGEMYSVHLEAMTRTSIEEEMPAVFIYEIVERNGFSGINVEKWKQ